MGMKVMRESSNPLSMNWQFKEKTTTFQRKLFWITLDSPVFNKRTVAAYVLTNSKQLRGIYPNLLEAKSDFYLMTTVLSLKC